MAKSDYKGQRSVLAQMLKEEPTVTPIQEVRPVSKKPVTEELVRINGFDVPADLARRMKIYAATTDMKQREILIKALEAYLPK